MVKTRCEQAAKYLLPAIRALVASKLISKYGLTQVVAAKKMGTTQAAISYYINSKRGLKAITVLKKDNEIMKDIETIAEMIHRGVDNGEVTDFICKLCKKIITKGLLTQIS